MLQRRLYKPAQYPGVYTWVVSLCRVHVAASSLLFLPMIVRLELMQAFLPELQSQLQLQCRHEGNVKAAGNGMGDSIHGIPWCSELVYFWKCNLLPKCKIIISISIKDNMALLAKWVIAMYWANSERHNNYILPIKLFYCVGAQCMLHSIPVVVAFYNKCRTRIRRFNFISEIAHRTEFTTDCQDHTVGEVAWLLPWHFG